MTFRLPDAGRGVVIGGIFALLLAGCGGGSSDSTAPDQQNENTFRLLTVAPDAPGLATTTVSFYAVRGKNAGVDLWYHARPGQKDSTKFLEYRMGGATLDRRPDGSVIAQGDSVRITLTVTNPTNLIVDFQPSGLLFSAKDPARLKMFFAECGDDLDRNGRVDGNDDAIQQQLGIWRRERSTDPWIKLSSVVVKGTKEIDADLGGFTGYAVAY